MTVSCEAFLDYAYEGNTNLPLSVRIQNAITKVIEVFQKFILKVKGIKKERVVPRKVLDAYVKLSNNVWNRMVECKSAFQSDKTPPTFSEPFDSQEYKTLFSEDVKKHTSPGEYVKIQSSVVLNRMNGVLTALTAAKNGLRSIDKESNPGKAQACTQMINYGKFMMKISNRVLSYKNMYVEKKHLQNTPIDDEEDEKKSTNESFMDFEREINLAIVTEGLFDLFKKREKVESTPEAKKLEAEIRKKVCDHLIKYSKQSNFVNEYRKAICSFPNMEIKIVSHGVQIAKTKDGLTEPKDWPDYIKNKYYGPRIRKGTIYEKYNDAFNNKWYHELLQEGKDWCRKNCTVPDNFILQLWDDNGTENILYIEVFEKISK